MQVKLYKVGEQLPFAKTTVPYAANFDFDAHTIEPPPMQKTTPSLTVRNAYNVHVEAENMKSGLLTEMARAAAEAKDVEVPDCRPDAESSLKPACFILTHAVVLERARRAKLAAPAMSLAGGLESVKTGLKTRAGITIPDAIIAAMILRKPVPFLAVTTPALRAFSLGQREFPTKSSPLTAFGGKARPYFDAGAFLGPQGESFPTELADVIDAHENLVLIAQYITPANASPGSNLADHLRAHVEYIRTNVSPAFKLDRWVRWSGVRMSEMIGSGKPFSARVHDAFFTTIEIQDMQQVGDKRASTEPEYRAPRPTPAAPRAQRPDMAHLLQRPPYFAAPDANNGPWHAASFPQNQPSMWSGPTSSMPAQMPSTAWSASTPPMPAQMPPTAAPTQPNPAYWPNNHYQQQQLASGSNAIAVPAGNGQHSFQGHKDLPPVCPVCRAHHIYRDCTATVDNNGRGFFACSVKDASGNASLVVASDPARRICVYYNVYGTCRGHKGEQLHICSTCGSAEPGHTLRGNH
ncbi:hypothetical protein C8F04DRAFT_1259386 [Mycena alexandri]|uniref:Uncharacterized protein n=1 Tax=Mycena alexandri TaxID=1745969 RepID=A0AAD6SZ97_9AGAR|nr:hypothetical protein C8F04DRAFT_1259386 [Mycena alexandri]